MSVGVRLRGRDRLPTSSAPASAYVILVERNELTIVSTFHSAGCRYNCDRASPLRG